MLGKIGDILGKAIGLVDEIITSDEERLELKRPLVEAQAGILHEVIQWESRYLDARERILETELKSDSWLTRSWRPVLMLAIGTMLILSWGGLVPPPPEWLGKGLETMMTVYLGGRSLEKLVPATAKALKAKEIV